MVLALNEASVNSFGVRNCSVISSKKSSNFVKPFGKLVAYGFDRWLQLCSTHFYIWTLHFIVIMSFVSHF